MRRSPLLMLVIPFLFVGCASMLPKSQTITDVHGRGYVSIKGNYLALKEGETKRVEAEKLGFDYRHHPNAKQIDYFEVRKLFLGDQLAANVADLPAGIQECLRAQALCVGQIFSAGDEHSDHVGNFWKDKLGFEEVIQKTRWFFSVQIFYKRQEPNRDHPDDVVVFKRNPEDTPNTVSEERNKDNLGPFTKLWDALSGAAGKAETFAR